MKLLLTVVQYSIIIALCQRENPQASKTIVKRSVNGLDIGYYLERFVYIVAKQCLANGATQAQADKLRGDISGILGCTLKQPLFFSEKKNFLANLRECSKESVREAKECLAKNQQDIPGLILEIIESLSSFLYKDLSIIQGSLAVCTFVTFGKQEFQTNFKSCINQAEGTVIYNSESFCTAFIHTFKCFPKMVKEYCEDKEDLRQLRNDFLETIRKPCESLYQTVHSE